MQARYYDPLIGRFLSIDPVGFSPDMPFMFGRYTYVGNDPVNLTDPTGKNPAAGATVGCAMTGPACPVGAIAGAIVGTVVVVAVAVAINEIDNDGQEDSTPTGDDVNIDDKIEEQLDERGWSEEEVRDLTTEEPSGKSVDNTGRRSDPATVYGDKDGYVVVNDETGDVVQVSDKHDPNWIPDDRIEWED